MNRALRQRAFSRAVLGPQPNAGVALVITLILLAVITFMTVTFLVVTRAESGNVKTVMDQTTARLAAEQAIEEAKEQIMIPMMTFTNPFTVGLMVSTNFIASAGFSTTTGYKAYTNVNYYDKSGVMLTGNDYLQNLNNQLYDPRPPVFVSTNGGTGLDFRFYLDLNRNGFFDPSGWQYVTNTLGQRVVDANGAFVTNFVIGDPQWIGILERGAFTPSLLNLTAPPRFSHSADNRYLSRYAFIVLPSSQGLDINHIHNYSKGITPPNMLAGDGFRRNMGVGTFEINLGAFLADLNTNQWNAYTYNITPAANAGPAFDDAVALLRYRYLTNWRNNLSVVPQLFGPAGANVFRTDFRDGFSAGPIMTLFQWNPGPDHDTIPITGNIGWPGAENPNRFYDEQDFFDNNKTRVGVPTAAVGFTDRLTNACQQIDTYNRYTFYRLLSQMGVDSGPEPPKINLNSINVDTNSGAIVPDLATNFQAWNPPQFLTRAAIAILTNLLKDATNFVGDTNRWMMANTPDQPFYIADPTDAQFYNPSNYLDFRGPVPTLRIQIYPTNFYSPAIHRAFQLAANMYDASGVTNRGLLAQPVPATNGFPTVFQPIFLVQSLGPGTNAVYLTNFVEVTDARLAFTNKTVFRDLSNPLDRTPSALMFSPFPMVYGVPLVVGARKGFPNFNQFAMQTQIRVTRKLEFRRNGGGPIFETNQMYVLVISNTFAAEAWNSYRAPYPRDLQMVGVAEMMAVVTNELGQTMTLVQNGITYLASNNVVRATPNAGAPPGISIPGGTWPGWLDRNHVRYSFQIPFATTNNFAYLPRCKYSETLRQFISPEDSIFVRPSRFPIPHWYVRLRTRFRMALVDVNVNPPRIVDYANLESQEPPLDLTELLQRKDPDVSPSCKLYPSDVDENQMWCTNKNSNDDLTPSWGVLNQIALGAGSIQPSKKNYSEYDQLPNSGAPGSEMCQINYFRKQIGLGAPGTIGFLKDECRGEFDRFNLTNIFYAPFVPRKDIWYYTQWQVNDPLVHYTVSDLTDPTLKRIHLNDDTADPPLKDIEDKVLSRRYEPWNYKLQISDKARPENTIMDMSVKDPLVTRSDDWNFPTNKFPNLGWLGRVHRGTPWQTVYFKAPQVYAVGTNIDAQRYWRTNAQRWMKWSGHVATNFYGLGTMNVDFFLTHPTNDYRLLDLFTTAISDNSSRGQLPVNQSGLAAWSAVLSGVAVKGTIATNSFSFIQPAGSYNALNPSTWPPMVRIWDAINRTRNSTVPVFNSSGQVVGTNDVFPGKQFAHLGDILNVPELSIGQATFDKAKGYWVNASPFLDFGANAADVNSGLTANQQNLMSDEVYERIPQQILSLLRSGEQPRFVIYAFGQTLRPAEHSVVSGGSFPGMITNYQVTAESALRAVVRVDGAPKNPRVVIEDFSVLPPYQ